MNGSKKIIHYVLAASLMLLYPVLSLAQVGGMSGPSFSITTIGIAIANFMWVLFTLIAVISFVITGINFLTTMGDSTKAADARRAFIWGIVGIVVAIIAYSIIAITRNALGA